MHFDINEAKRQHSTTRFCPFFYLNYQNAPNARWPIKACPSQKVPQILIETLGVIGLSLYLYLYLYLSLSSFFFFLLNSLSLFLLSRNAPTSTISTNHNSTALTHLCLSLILVSSFTLFHRSLSCKLVQKR